MFDGDLGGVIPATVPPVGFEDLEDEYGVAPSADPSRGEPALAMSTSGPFLPAPQQGYRAPSGGPAMTHRPAPSPGRPLAVRPGHLSTYAVPYGAPLTPQWGNELPGVPFGAGEGTTPPAKEETKINWLPWVLAMLAIGGACGATYLLLREKSKHLAKVRA